MAESAIEDSIAVELEARSDRELTILRSAYHVMARSGSNRLNLQDIADEAGVSKGLILYHFQTKNAVLQHAMQWALIQTGRRIRTRLQETASDDPLVPLLDAIFVSPQANRDFHLVYLDLIEHSVRERSFADLPNMTRDIIEPMYAEVIREGVERGAFAVDDVDDAAVTMRVVIDGTFIQWLQREDWQPSHATFKQRCHDTLARLLAG